MNKCLLKYHLEKNGDTQEALSIALGLSRSRLSAKINGYRGACFKQSEIAFIKDRYGLKAEEVDHIFFGI